jgi:replicative DNA helicase
MREPPHNFEMEQALLGTMLADNGAYHRVSETVKPEHFADPLHGKLFDAIAKLVDRGQVANVLSMKTLFETDPAMKAGGGTNYLARLYRSSGPAQEAPTYAEQVRDLYLRRKIIQLSEGATAAAYSPHVADDALKQIEGLERGLFDLAETGHTGGGFKSFTASLTNATQLAEVAHRRKGGLVGVGTGFRALDRLLGGMHPSDLIVLAGRPSMGKTALATNIAFHAARAYRTEPNDKGVEEVVEGAKVGFFSLEMSNDQLVNRIVSEQARIPSQKIRQGELNGADFDRYLEAAGGLEGLPLYINEAPALSMGALRTEARRLKRQHGLGLIIVDYLQLLVGSGRGSSENRVQEVSEISRGLKTLAKELHVPVLALSQLSRAVEQRTDKHPLLSDLRESGTIEQDADVVMFVYRDEYYLERSDKKGSPEHIEAMSKAEVIIAKQRHGPTGTAHLKFDGAFTRFGDLPDAAPS